MQLFLLPMLIVQRAATSENLGVQAVDNQFGSGSALFLFFGHIEITGLRFDCKAVNSLLGGGIRDLLLLACTQRLNCPDFVTVSSDKDAAPARGGPPKHC